MISTSVYASFTAGSFRCYRSPDGRTPRLLGCSHETPRQAIAHTFGSYTSPLRDSGSGSSRVPGGPPSPVYDEPPPELRKQLPAVRTGRR